MREFERTLCAKQFHLASLGRHININQFVTRQDLLILDPTFSISLFHVFSSNCLIKETLFVQFTKWPWGPAYWARQGHHIAHPPALLKYIDYINVVCNVIRRGSRWVVGTLPWSKVVGGTGHHVRCVR